MSKKSQSLIHKISAYEAEKKSAGLSEPKTRLLFCLMETGGSSYLDIAEKADINTKTLLRYVGDLRKAGYLTRGTGTEEFSTAIFSLSDSGKDLVKKLLSHLEKEKAG